MSRKIRNIKTRKLNRINKMCMLPEFRSCIIKFLSRLQVIDGKEKVESVLSKNR